MRVDVEFDFAEFLIDGGDEIDDECDDTFLIVFFEVLVGDEEADIIALGGRQQ